MSAFQSYRGICNICGVKGEFLRGENRSTREAYPCPSCRASLRYRDQGALVIDEFAKGKSVFFRHLVSSGMMDGISVYEPALKGPFVDALRKQPNYTRSYFWPDRPLGGIHGDGVRNEDLTQLTFPDQSFDLVITSDVLEHLYDYEAAFSEISRVLRIGGVHIFTIPNSWPIAEKTERRVEIVGGVENHLRPARYHTSGDGSPCLVYQDYGADIVDIIGATGCHTQIVRRHSAIDPCYVNATFISRRMR